MSELVFLEKRNGVGHVIMNSAPANAMSPEFMKQLSELLGQLESDSEIRAVLFRSALEKIFMAGADLKHLLSLDEEDFRKYIETAQDLVNQVELLPKPTMAVLSGHAMGGGCEFALACDFRYMSESKALIGLPEVTLGLLPGAGGTQRLPRLIGRSKATELLLTGKVLPGPEAQAIGLVDRVYPVDQLLAESMKAVESLARGATCAIGQIKACLRKPSHDLLADGLAQELDGITYLFKHTHDTKEGIAAFNEKRAPKYQGK
ncbi:MAG: enoyl-CoA hydratase/isomerase family protein [Deltaproteobacteria bacterium]|jgi:enoyl-CoA hydratase|nr:enoyl-CoA hydratase/isomerase family protein [Deltaproteobacteria bacterium]